MFRSLLCLTLLTIGTQAAAQTCQNVNLVSQGMVDDEVASAWNFVSFAAYSGESPTVPSGVKCEVDVTLGGGNAVGLPPAPAGTFEGVTQVGKEGNHLGSLERRLAVYPALLAHDEISVYELRSGAYGAVESEDLLVHVVASSQTTGVVYVVRVQHYAGQPDPEPEILLEANYNTQRQGPQCLSVSAPVCVTMGWNASHLDGRLNIRVAVADKTQDVEIDSAKAVPAMRMGYLGATHLSGGVSKVKLGHKVCSVDGVEVPGACSH